MTFKAFMQKEWTLKEDRIIIGGKTIMLSSIKQVESRPLKPGAACGVISVIYGSGAFDFATLCYPKNQQEDADKAAKYILEAVGGEAYKEKVAAYEKAKTEGFRKYCNVCGHIFCYTFEDLDKNKRLANSAVLSGVSGVAGALSGFYGASAVQNLNAENQLNRIVDYSKCPKCGSIDIRDATEEEIEQNKAPQSQAVQQLSSADELKKFKDLLDAGVITQEEFDAKKKQLWGL